MPGSPPAGSGDVDAGKFSWNLEGKEVVAQFADITFFRKGLIDLIGLPDLDIRRGMEAEHCSGVPPPRSTHSPARPIPPLLITATQSKEAA
jgi:hypothetical protein